MKKISVLAILTVVTVTLFSFKPLIGKLTTTKTHIKFFSSTPAEDIEAHNYKSIGTLDTQNGEVVFSVPMQSFEFEKALMQKHFNSDKFLDTKTFPKAKFVGSITNLSEINFEKNGTYQAHVKGELTLHGKTNPLQEKISIQVIESLLKTTGKFTIKLADYGIAFEKGKPSTNISKTVDITIDAEFQK